MSQIDPEVLYLILTKVAARETVYGYDAAQAGGTITQRQLADVYERITSNRIGATLNWGTPLGQLNQLLAACGLPSLGAVVAPKEPAPAPVDLTRIHATKWPAFSALKNLYRKPARR